MMQWEQRLDTAKEKEGKRKGTEKHIGGTVVANVESYHQCAQTQDMMEAGIVLEEPGPASASERGAIASDFLRGL